MRKVAQARTDPAFDLPEIPGAAKPTDVPAAPTNRAPAAAPVQTGVGQVQGSLAVKQMQFAISSIYDLLKDSKIFSIQDSNGAHPLSSSILRYVNKSSILGKEEGQKEGSIFNIDKLVSSLNTFGKTQKRPDGIWGQYTNNALKNLYAVTQSIFYLMYKLSTKQDVYSIEDLELLKRSIPENPAKLQDKDEAAKAITKNITKIKALIGSFHQGLTGEHSPFTSQVSDNKPFDTSYSKKYQEIDSKNMQVPVLNVKLPSDLADPEQEQIPLIMSHLANKQSFEHFVQQSNIMVNGKSPLQDPNAMKELLSFIENKIKSANVRATQKPAEPGH
jgi:hypothetical protein